MRIANHEGRLVVVTGEAGREVAHDVEKNSGGRFGPEPQAIYEDWDAFTGWAIDHILKAIDILLSAHGAGSFADANPLQRIWRDSSVAARHAVVLPVIGYEVYGKALLGRDDHITPLV